MIDHDEGQETAPALSTFHGPRQITKVQILNKKN